MCYHHKAQKVQHHVFCLLYLIVLAYNLQIYKLEFTIEIKSVIVNNYILLIIAISLF